VPGCVDGWDTLHRRYGRLPLHEILSPAIAACRHGVRVPPVIASMWHRAWPLLAHDAGARATFLPAGRAPRAGETAINPGLGATLEAIANDGPSTFYRGAIAERLATFSRATGGCLTEADLADHRSTWVDPLCVDTFGVTVWELPPPTQGIAVLQMLKLLEGFDLEALGHNTPAYLHRLIEAKKLVYEDRAAYIADPEAAPDRCAELLATEYGARRRALIDPDRASERVRPGLPDVTGDTVYLSVVDEQRNAVSFIQSIYQGFGSGIVPHGLGFALQNRGSLFHLDARHPNRLEPGKRPFHTIIPGFVTRHGVPWFSFGVMGGDMQPQGQLQVLLNLLQFGMDPQRAADAQRFRHEGSSSPTGVVRAGSGTVLLEPRLYATAAGPLRALGHRVECRTEGFGGYQGILIDERSGMLFGGTEPRKDGCARGL
jgi:gamma-glutamyltranspeptidase/glutathione hydrolase